MGKKLFSLCMALALCLSLLPVTALAADGIELYVAGQQITESGCYANQDGTWTKVDGTEPASGQFYYDAATATLTLNEAKIVNYQYVTVGGGFTYPGSVIAFSQSADVSLTIVVSQGTSNITGTGGIRVVSKAGDASLSISGPGSLEVNVDKNDSGISLIGSKNVNLNIDSADVKTLAAYYYGVDLHAGDGFKAAAVVNNGKLTAGGSGGIGIYYRWTNPSDSGTSSLTVSGNAVVDTRDSKILIASQASEVQVSAGSDGNGGIVFNGKNGTVYGDVTLQDDLEIKSGESLTVGKDASLTVPEDVTLTNNGKIDNSGKLTVDGGTLTGNVTGDVIYKVTGVSLNTDSLTLVEGGTATLTATVKPNNATNKNVTWSSDGTSVATVDDTGKVTAISVGSATITATTQDGNKTATCSVTVTAPPEPEPEPEPTPPPYIPPTYAVTTPETTGGTVTVSPTRASSGRTVTITAAPDLGYALESLTVLDSRGNEIALTDKGDGKYTFTMPAGRVTVEASFTPAPLPFEDVAPGAWYESAVRYAYFHNIMEGMRETEFSPTTALTRAMAAQILYNLEGQPDLSDENLGHPYEDVDAQAWYGNAVYWARITGVATGYGDGTFQPGDSITRQEFAQMLYNYAKYKGYDLTAEGDLSTFPDANSIADWAEAAMRWANGNQLINGHDDGTIDAAGIGTRAQAASILMKFDQNVVEN